MIRFRMAKINMAQFAILVDKAPTDGIAYTVNLGFNAAANAKRTACVFSVEFIHNDRTILKLEIICEFDLHPEDWDNSVKNGVLTLTKDNLGLLANQTIGVARGIMFCKTEDTPFQNFILPPIDLTRLLDKDLKIDLGEAVIRESR